MRQVPETRRAAPRFPGAPPASSLRARALRACPTTAWPPKQSRKPAFFRRSASTNSPTASRSATAATSPSTKCASISRSTITTRLLSTARRIRPMPASPAASSQSCCVRTSDVRALSSRHDDAASVRDRDHHRSAASRPRCAPRARRRAARARTDLCKLPFALAQGRWLARLEGMADQHTRQRVRPRDRAERFTRWCFDSRTSSSGRHVHRS